MKRLLSTVLCLALLAGCTTTTQQQGQQDTKDTQVTSSVAAIDVSNVSLVEAPFGESVKPAETEVTMNEDIAKDFPLSDIANIADMEKAYGFTFTDAEKEMLEQHKFVMKPLYETNIIPNQTDLNREFIALYEAVEGPFDARDRTQANALFLSSDLFLNAYNLLYVELLKEAENTSFAPSMKTLSRTFFDEAQKKVDATTGDEQAKWKNVRNYFAVPYALLANSVKPLAMDDMLGGGAEDPKAKFDEKDKTADAQENVVAFIKKLTLDAPSEKAVLKDIDNVYKADGKHVPEILKEEYEQYAKDTDISFSVDFSQFTPRSHYTGISLRRQYFRSMMWFSQLAFFVKSPAMTEEAFAMAQLLAEKPQQLKDYNQLESTINFMVGTSDDLMPVDYLRALDSAKDSDDKEAAVMEYLVKAHAPKIKAIPAEYPDVGVQDTADVLLKTKGMRFFSGKFILDSYWTGMLTQGDEAPKPGYTQKLPPMASSLEVMALLGSSYAASQIPTLDFYTPETKDAIEQAMTELADEAKTLEASYWQSNIYNGWLWVVKSLLTWHEVEKDSLPAFMQSPNWPIKTLMTAAGFWTELRHATLLYAKQSFAEAGAGPPACDPREIAPAPKGYIEPQLEAYDRLIYVAKRTEAGLKDQGFENLSNMPKLASYITALEHAQSYVQKQLQNETLIEKTKEVRGPDPYEDGKECVTHELDGESDWETIRLQIISELSAALPQPADGPILAAKDKRAAIIADVHTGGDIKNPLRILYEGTGVPYVIFVAVKDSNGPRLTIGFTYSQYEFTKAFGGQRMTDEEWQKNFYKEDENGYDAFQYTDKDSWPAVNPWFEALFPAQ